MAKRTYYFFWPSKVRHSSDGNLQYKRNTIHNTSFNLLKQVWLSMVKV